MATVATRSLSKKDRFDRVAVKVNKETYKDKWGILEIDVTQYAWGTGTDAGDYGKVDLRVPKYNADNDDPLVDNVNLTLSGGTTAVTKKYYVAVNNGEPGASAFVQPDGSWDLLYLDFELPEDNTLDPLAVTLTYAVSFTDLTPGSNPADDGNLVLNVTNSKIHDQGFITKPSTDFTNKNGYVIVQINDLHTIAIDRPVDTVITTTVKDDSVPLFTVENDKTTSGAFTTKQLINHPTSKVSGDRTYDKQLMVFAINDGKADGNARNVKATTNYVSFLKTTLQKIANWPCDDFVTVTVDYSSDFTEII